MLAAVWAGPLGRVPRPATAGQAVSCAHVAGFEWSLFWLLLRAWTTWASAAPSITRRARASPSGAPCSRSAHRRHPRWCANIQGFSGFAETLLFALALALHRAVLLTCRQPWQMGACDSPDSMPNPEQFQ